MAKYHNFIGIDIGKFNFIVAIHEQASTKEYENSSVGINKFIDDHKDILFNSLCVLETTGGYELELLYTLCKNNFPVHRANTRKVKNFIRSFGSSAKTDILDAKALANYGCDRSDKLEMFAPQSKETICLFQLIQRRNDLKQMMVAEKNRIRMSGDQLVQKSIKKIIKSLENQIELITERIREIITADKILKEKLRILKTVPGIGDIVAFELIILLPELGQLPRKKIASLAGLAPKANDSGRFKGYRKTGHGRQGVKPVLFMAAMAARKSKTVLKSFYEKLIMNGKKKMVALTALMRKILVIANARLKKTSICLINNALDGLDGAKTKPAHQTIAS